MSVDAFNVTSSALDSRFTEDEFEKLSASIKESWRILPGIAAVLMVVVASIGGALVGESVGVPAILLAIGLSIAHYYLRLVPRRRLALYTAALQAWNYACARSNPVTLLAMPVPRQEGEIAFYHERSVRYEERHVGSTKQSTNAVQRAVVGELLFGPVGAIVGGSSATYRTAETYDTVAVDSGDLVITNQRFLFLGQRNTAEIPIQKVMRWMPITGTHRVIVEYAGRAPGESYDVLPLVFPMCMVRRGHNASFQVPDPPTPLPLSATITNSAEEPQENRALSV